MAQIPMILPNTQRGVFGRFRGGSLAYSFQICQDGRCEEGGSGVREDGKEECQDIVTSVGKIR